MMYLTVEAVEDSIICMLRFERAEKLTYKGQLFLMAVLALKKPLVGNGKEVWPSPKEGGFEVD